uniref:sodium:solute symporter family protein n=1 Tax=Sedimenticola sp. TaxID=1940285 RepID=UPI003D146F4B
MTNNSIVLLASFGYLGLLFAVAYYADKRADHGKPIANNPYIYTLSIAVYCTAWTFYGSVGRAATGGVSFLPIYLGPTLVATLWWLLLRKIIRISKQHRITSIADFIASRYGKSMLLGGLVSIIAVVGIMPYIALQLKAVSVSYTVLTNYPDTGTPINLLWHDTAFYVAMLLAAFSILFGTRHIDATERHEGLVVAIAFESVVKLLAFLAVGVFVTYGIFGGMGDLFERAAAVPEIARLMSMEAVPGGYTSWFTLLFLSMTAILFLPRQFQVAVVENVNEQHVSTASWLFPFYLLVINIFVLPIAFGGLMVFPNGGVDPDTYVLTLPLVQGQELLALLVYLGGLSAATGMVIVATIALSIMVSNDLVMPVLLRSELLGLSRRADLSRFILNLRRAVIVGVLVMGYLYYRLIGESYALVTIGLVSFAAAAQFAPPILLGMYWKGASRSGALAGLVGGFSIWAFTLVVPAFVHSGWLPASILEQGLFGWQILKPYELFGLRGLDSLSHSVFWSMLFNIGLLVIVSMFTRQSDIERVQATLFVDVFRRADGEATGYWHGTASVEAVHALLARFLGRDKADRAITRYAQLNSLRLDPEIQAPPGLVNHAERLLAGTIGAASARVMISSVVEGEELSFDGVMTILDEATQVIEYSHRLEQKSRALEKTTNELKTAN